jgi:hypothetical protein
MNGLTSTGMAQKCRDMNVLFTDASKLQAGDLIFLPARTLPAAKVIARTPNAVEQANANAGCRYTMLPYTSTANF